jgi:hypothetical protein
MNRSLGLSWPHTRAQRPWIVYLLDLRCLFAVVIAPIFVMRWAMSNPPPKGLATLFKQLGVLRTANVSIVQILTGIVLTSGIFGFAPHWRRWHDQAKSTRIEVLLVHGIGMGLGFAGVGVAASSQLDLHAPERTWLLILGACLGVVTVLSITILWFEMSRKSRVLRWLGIAIAITVTACASFPPLHAGTTAGGFSGPGAMTGMPTTLPPFFQLVNRFAQLEGLSARLPMRAYQSVIGSAWTTGSVPLVAILVCVLVTGFSLALTGLALRRSINHNQIEDTDQLGGRLGSVSN